jgi:oligopeptide transport system permease protein
MTPKIKPKVSSQAGNQAEHFVSKDSMESLAASQTQNITTSENESGRSVWKQGWLTLKKDPFFWVSAVLLAIVCIVALFPDVFAHFPPDDHCQLSNADGGPQAGHPLGFTNQGCDIYSRIVHGASSSLLVGALSTLGVVIIGSLLGAIAGFFGGFVDTIISRMTDIFFALPFILGAVVLLQMPAFKNNRSVFTVAIPLVIFGWPQVARITRGAVLEIKNTEFIKAARTLGASEFSIMFRHVLPNAMAPIIVVGTMLLGSFIVAEATLSFLGLGLPSSVMSWGNDIAAAKSSLRTHPAALIYPSIALSVTVLSFILLGDAVRSAFDPHSRRRS